LVVSQARLRHDVEGWLEEVVPRESDESSRDVEFGERKRCLEVVHTHQAFQPRLRARPSKAEIRRGSSSGEIPANFERIIRTRLDRYIERPIVERRLGDGKASLARSGLWRWPRFGPARKTDREDLDVAEEPALRNPHGAAYCA